MNLNNTKNKLNLILQECHLHIKRITYARLKLNSLTPLSLESYQALNDENVEAFDQFLFRFGKLQDTIGQRLFNVILELLQENIKQKPFLDKLNRLEQLGALENKEQWLSLINIRNKVAHEYETDPTSTFEALNSIYNSYVELESVFLKLEKYIQPYM